MAPADAKQRWHLSPTPLTHHQFCAALPPSYSGNWQSWDAQWDAQLDEEYNFDYSPENGVMPTDTRPLQISLAQYMVRWFGQC